MELTDNEVIYLWDALYCLSPTQANGCSNISGESMKDALLDKLQTELERRKLA